MNFEKRIDMLFTINAGIFHGKVHVVIFNFTGTLNIKFLNTILVVVFLCSFVIVAPPGIWGTKTNQLEMHRYNHQSLASVDKSRHVIDPKYVSVKNNKYRIVIFTYCSSIASVLL